jgi:putative transposase
MARQPRLIVPGVALHIVQRGNNRGACFDGDSDSLCYLTYLRKLSARHGCLVHAYCLMTNHVHLLVTPQRPDSSTNLMRDLGQSYVKYFNRRHGRSGTLWEGRFRSCVVESAQYVLACYRYIELNPLRAGMVGHPCAYAWSSYAVNSGAAFDTLLAPHTEYLALGADPSARHAAYAGLFQNALDHSVVTAIRDATQGSLPLGSESFKSKLIAGGRKVEHQRPGPRPGKKKEAEGDLQLKIVL